MSASTLDIRRRLTIFMIVSYMVVWLEISTAAPIALRLEFGNARVMPWTWQSFTANAVCGPSEGCLIIFGGIVLMPRVISSTVALAMFLQHEHHLREAADYIPIDQLGTTDDCGFVPFADDTSSRRNMTVEKIGRAHFMQEFWSTSPTRRAFGARGHRGERGRANG